jgi:hypothetical protein
MQKEHAGPPEVPPEVQSGRISLAVFFAGTGDLAAPFSEETNPRARHENLFWQFVPDGVGVDLPKG